MSIKTSTEEWVRKGPIQAIAVIAAAGIVVGGLVGVGVGFKVEQSRTKSDVSDLRKQVNKLKNEKSGVRAGALGQRVGTVTAKSASSITVTTKRDRKTQTLAIGASTVFEIAQAGTIADVHSGRRVLVTVGGGEIIVLPDASKLGRVVAKVASDVIKIDKANGFPAGSIKTTDVHKVETLKAATAADIKIGDAVLVGGRAKNATTFNAIEVIVLPDGSGFAG